MSEIAIAEQQAPLTLLEQTNPVMIIDEATIIANALADIIEQKKLYTIIKGKKHVHVEGWTTLGALLKVFPILDTSKRLDRNDEIIYESRIVAKTLKGEIVGIGEALCSDKEMIKRKDGTMYQKWDDEYAIKSMSITRATSKSLRIPLGWIMVLAGYEGTPAEEMEGVKNQENTKFGSGPARTSKVKPKSAVKNPIDLPLKGHENAVDAQITVKEGGKPNGKDAITEDMSKDASTEKPLYKHCMGICDEFDQICESTTNKDALISKKLKEISKKLKETGSMTTEQHSDILEMIKVWG